MDYRPVLHELVERVRTTKWYVLGVQLGLEDNTLEGIKTECGNNVDECRTAMFREWLRTSSECSRKQLLDALRTHSVAEIYIADEYERCFHKRRRDADVPPSLPSKESKLHDNSVACYKISEKYHPEFDEKRGELRILISKVTKILKNKPVSFDDLKFFLSLYPELRKDAEAAESLNDTMRVVCDYTSLTNTKILEAVAKEVNLQDAIDLIKKFNISIDEFCETIQTQHIYGQDFMEHSHKNLLKSDLEEVKFVLEWKGDETTLSDIQSLLRKAFHDNARHVMVKVVNEGNSIIVICYAPLHLHYELIELVKDNKEDLRNEKVLSVTIGGCIIIKRNELNTQEYVKENPFCRSASLEEQGEHGLQLDFTVPTEVHHGSQLAAKVAETRIKTLISQLRVKDEAIRQLKEERPKTNEVLALTSQVKERDEKIRKLKEELHKRTKKLEILTEEKQDELDYALYEAVKKQHLFVSKILLNNGADPNMRHDLYKQTPLLLSSMSGDVDTVNVLLSHEAYIDIKDGADQRTPLHWSSMIGHVDIVNVLVSHGAHIDVQDKYKQTPLHLSCLYGHSDIVKVLLSHGADIHVKDELGRSPRDLAHDHHSDKYFICIDGAQKVIEMLERQERT